MKPGDSMVSTISLTQSVGIKSEWKTAVYHRGVRRRLQPDAGGGGR